MLLVDLAGLVCPVLLLAVVFWETPLMLKTILLLPEFP